jgi:hypothetical protein
MTAQESAFVRWLLEHGDARARAFLPQLDSAWVVGKCSCGCASINFSIGGATFYGKRIDGLAVGMETIVEYEWKSAEGALFGVFAFACNGLLAGLDVWSQDGQHTASELPATAQLRAYVD